MFKPGAIEGASASLCTPMRVPIVAIALVIGPAGLCPADELLLRERSIPTPTGWIWGIDATAFSPDGRLLAFGGTESLRPEDGAPSVLGGEVRLCDAASGRTQAVLRDM